MQVAVFMPFLRTYEMWVKNEIFYDSIIIGDIENCYQLAQQLSDLSISKEKYRVCTGQCIKAVTVVQIAE